MPNAQDVREKRFWNNYLAILLEFHIKSSAHPWYVRHCERFIRHSHCRLKQHSQASVTRYLQQLLQQDRLAAWQVEQAIHALQLLFKMIRAPFYQQIDWDHWKASSIEHGKEHDTHYRSNHPAERIDYSIEARTGKSQSAEDCRLNNCD